ncbi:MAG TPA: ATP-binding protein [Stellaceae bacterium]|nr:ATP-binding protein [Stellaceae bacterium]
MTWPIIVLPIESEADVVLVRQLARRLAELAGFERQAQTRIATAVSEIARNAFGYAGSGRAEFAIENSAAGQDSASQRFRIRVSDKGPGIADLQSILDGRYRSPTGMGLGLVGARRLMEHFRIESEAGRGTLVELAQSLPARLARLTQARVLEVVTILAAESSKNSLDALREQNQELMQIVDDLRERDEEGKRLNQELSDTNRGVVALYAELDERAEQLRQASELKSRFLSNMSHEFRTPLNSVLALSRLLLDRIDGDLTPEQERQVGFIRRSADDLLELVNDLLDLAKVEAGKVDVNSITFTVQELFSTLRGSLRPLLASPHIDLVFDVAPDMPSLTTDEAKVAQILRNLISNALKFTEKGEVVVTARHRDNGATAIFSVRDTGIGIPAEEQQRIFEEFSQIDNPLGKKVKGTGLGLPLSRSLAGLLDGRIGLESAPGQGSVFTLTIPSSLDSVPPPPTPLAAPDPGRKRVLVVDDDETFRYVIKQIISNDPQYEVVEANDGDIGLRRARDDRPDVIVLDLQMPNMDGFTALAELRADQRTRGIPVIVATSLAVSPALSARLPAGTRLLSKSMISRENVWHSLHEATGGNQT